MSTNSTAKAPLESNVFLNSDGTSSNGRILAAVGAFSGVALLCNIELWVLIFIKFRKRKGLYFWSILFASIGAFLYNINVILAYFITAPVPSWAFIVTGSLGYLIYVPSEYAVLYSRLHLLSTSTRVLRWTMALTATEYVLATIPLAVTWAWGLVDPENVTVIIVRDRLLQVETCAYTAVEIVLSSIYIRQTLRMWATNPEPSIRSILVHLFCINILLVSLNCGTVAMLFTDNLGLANGWTVSQSLHSAIGD
jgi:hypothetical protein